MRGEQRSSDDPEDIEEPEPVQHQLASKVSTSRPKAENSKQLSLKNLKMSGVSDEPQGTTTRSYYRQNSVKGAEVGKSLHEEDAAACRETRGAHEAGKGPISRRGSSKRDDRVRTGHKLKIRGGAEDEIINRGRLISTSPMATGHVTNGRTALAHIR